MTKTAQDEGEVASSDAAGAVSRNLHGQKLGRKGKGTRDRILAACGELLADPSGTPLSLSEVARRASLGMTSLYNYFTDLTELLLAVLEPVMAAGQESLVRILRERWPDEDLDTRSYLFLQTYHDFWARHSRLLHLRNAMADEHDERMLALRARSTQPLINLMTAQLDGEPGNQSAPERGLATVLVLGMECTVTVATDHGFAASSGSHHPRNPDYYLQPAAHMLELAIRDTRLSRAAGSRA